MRLFDLPQARHFCCPTAASVAGIGRQSLVDYYTSFGKRAVFMKEGDGRYEIHQVNVLDMVERWLVYSVAHYRRSLDMLSPVSAPWAHVTLYYSAFYAASAMLGMFGGWLGVTPVGVRAVDVEDRAIGSQVLKVDHKVPVPAGVKGPHRVFWHAFYAGAARIYPWAPTDLADALTPVNGDVAWLISERNSINYDMHVAWQLSTKFHSTFSRARLASVVGSLGLQLEASERLLRLALHFATEIGLSNTALAGCGAVGTRLQMRRRLVTQSIPSLVAQSKLTELLEA